MKKDDMYFIFREFEEAVEFCNADCEKNDRAGFDVELIPDNFVSDVFMLSFFAICADGDVSPEEVGKLNRLLEDLGIEVEMDDAREALEIVKSEPFEIPKTLVMLQLRSFVKISDAAPENRDAVIDEEVNFLDHILCIYADLMCSMSERLSQNVQQVILDCLRRCCEYIADCLHISFTLSERVLAVIEKFR